MNLFHKKYITKEHNQYLKYKFANFSSKCYK